MLISTTIITFPRTFIKKYFRSNLKNNFELFLLIYIKKPTKIRLITFLYFRYCKSIEYGL